MLGAIIGDIVGSRFEFNNTSDFYFELFTSACDYTDDTICTVAVADAALNGKPYRETMLEWCRKYPHPMGCYGGSFARWIHTLNPEPYNSFGNGSAMRVGAVGWLFDAEEEVLEQAKLSAVSLYFGEVKIGNAGKIAKLEDFVVCREILITFAIG